MNRLEGEVVCLSCGARGAALRSRLELRELMRVPLSSWWCGDTLARGAVAIEM